MVVIQRPVAIRFCLRVYKCTHLSWAPRTVVPGLNSEHSPKTVSLSLASPGFAPHCFAPCPAPLSLECQTVSVCLSGFGTGSSLSGLGPGQPAPRCLCLSPGSERRWFGTSVGLAFCREHLIAGCRTSFQARLVRMAQRYFLLAAGLCCPNRCWTHKTRLNYKTEFWGDPG